MAVKTKTFNITTCLCSITYLAWNVSVNTQMLLLLYIIQIVGVSFIVAFFEKGASFRFLITD